MYGYPSVYRNQKYSVTHFISPITRLSCPCIPKAEIKTSQEGNSVINDNKFLVMSPEKCSTSSVVRMSLHYTRKACQLLNITHFMFICQSKKIWTHQQCFCSSLPTMSLYAHCPKSRLVQLPVGECSLEETWYAGTLHQYYQHTLYTTI